MGIYVPRIGHAIQQDVALAGGDLLAFEVNLGDVECDMAAVLYAGPAGYRSTEARVYWPEEQLLVFLERTHYGGSGREALALSVYDCQRRSLAQISVAELRDLLDKACAFGPTKVAK